MAVIALTTEKIVIVKNKLQKNDSFSISVDALCTIYFCFFLSSTIYMFFKIDLIYYFKYVVKHLDSYMALNTVTPQEGARLIAICLILFCTAPILQSPHTVRLNPCLLAIWIFF